MCAPSAFDFGRSDGRSASVGELTVLLARSIWRSFRMRAGWMVRRSVVEHVAGPQPNNAMQLASSSVGAPGGALSSKCLQLIASR